MGPRFELMAFGMPEKLTFGMAPDSFEAGYHCPMFPILLRATRAGSVGPNAMPNVVAPIVNSLTTLELTVLVRCRTAPRPRRARNVLPRSKLWLPAIQLPLGSPPP